MEKEKKVNSRCFHDWLGRVRVNSGMLCVPSSLGFWLEFVVLSFFLFFFFSTDGTLERNNYFGKLV